MYDIAETRSVARGVVLGVALRRKRSLARITASLPACSSDIRLGLAITSRTLADLRYMDCDRDRRRGLARLRGSPSFLPFVRTAAGGGFPSHPRGERFAIPPTSRATLLTSPTHGWLPRLIQDWPRFNEVLFPGFLALTLAAVGLFAGIRAAGTPEVGTPATRETVLIFGTIGLLAFWASFGPAAGLYSLLYYTIPLFSFLRAPSRLGPVVMMALAVLAAVGVRQLLGRSSPRRQTIAAMALSVVALLELNEVPFGWERAPVLPQPYTSGRSGQGTVAEFISTEAE